MSLSIYIQSINYNANDFNTNLKMWKVNVE
jgi:hypothetical protein